MIDDFLECLENMFFQLQTWGTGVGRVKVIQHYNHSYTFDLNSHENFECMLPKMTGIQVEKGIKFHTFRIVAVRNTA